MAVKIKKLFPRLPICLLLDGLYPKQNMFLACEDNGWKYIVNLKDGSLGNLQRDIKDTQEAKRFRVAETVAMRQGKETVYETAYYESIEDGLCHKGHIVHWVECYYPCPGKKAEKGKTTLNRFTYLTNFSIGRSERMVKAIVKAGRLRWKIEPAGRQERGF